MMKFAHLSDIHLGFQKEKSLQAIEQNIFESAFDDCIRRSVDFILVCGDMFHVNIPDMRVQKFAFAKFRQVHEAGIPVYVVYGSHDFSPTSTSVIDLLESTGYITKVQRPKGVGGDDNGISLEFVTDPKTEAKIVGIHGLAASKDIEYYDKLQRDELESEPGFKIFLFHADISEMRTATAVAAAAAEVAMPVSYMPRNFDYYAGGHIHKYQKESFDGYAHVVYPGTPFAGFHSDLEDNARGTKRGYVLVEFDNEHGVTDVRQIELPNCRYELLTVNADHRTSDAVNNEIVEKLDSIDPDEKIAILKVEGKLSEGKTTDINFKEIAGRLRENGAIEVKISSRRLSSAEYDIKESRAGTAEEIASEIFQESIGQVDSALEDLTGQKGAELAARLLDVLKKPALENEPLNVYQRRITADALEMLGLQDDITGASK